MEAYTGFAKVYDMFMEETPYETWAQQIVTWIGRYGVSKPCRGQEAKNRPVPETDEAQKLASERDLVVDLGCGTGTLTALLAQAGYDMIGVDNSGQMLQIAAQKEEKRTQDAPGGILYLQQDMQELELYGTAGTIVSMCDSINYLLLEEEVLQTFQRVNNYLYPGGLFIFDFNTVYKYKEIIADATIAENRETCSFIWENYYHEAEEINEYDLTFFVKEEGEHYRKFTETHYQRGYTAAQMESLLAQAGLACIQVLDADTYGPVSPESGRICIIAKECQKGAKST